VHPARPIEISKQANGHTPSHLKGRRKLIDKIRTIFVPIFEKRRWDMELATFAGYSTKALYCDRFQIRAVWFAHLQMSCPIHSLIKGESF
jgi:hypothetical protein